jgi:hypothetical protein
MKRTEHNTALKAVNFAAGIALLLMLTPHGGEVHEKPAGIRTAIELIGKGTPRIETQETVTALGDTPPQPSAPLGMR